MLKDFQIQLQEFIKKILHFLLYTVLGRLSLLAGVISVLTAFGLWPSILNFLNSTFSSLIGFSNIPVTQIPLYWLVILALLLGVCLFFLMYQYYYLRLVSGVFHDDFDKGLGKWEFGGEGWKSEQEDGKWILSVSESQDGGITKKGFSWSDYEVAFDLKIIKHNAGWLVRAENRNKYLMIQLHMEEENRPLLRLHLRIPPSSERDYEWIVTQEDKVNLSKPLKTREWIKVKTVVLGSNIDVYLNDEHCAHYFIADPIRWVEGFKKRKGEEDVDPSKDDLKRPYITSINYSSGKVGFRCAPPNEHAHFRKLRIRPKH